MYSGHYLISISSQDNDDKVMCWEDGRYHNGDIMSWWLLKWKNKRTTIRAKINQQTISFWFRWTFYSKLARYLDTGQVKTASKITIFLENFCLIHINSQLIVPWKHKNKSNLSAGITKHRLVKLNQSTCCCVEQQQWQTSQLYIFVCEAISIYGTLDCS